MTDHIDQNIKKPEKKAIINRTFLTSQLIQFKVLKSQFNLITQQLTNLEQTWLNCKNKEKG